MLRHCAWHQRGVGTQAIVCDTCSIPIDNYNCPDHPTSPTSYREVPELPCPWGDLHDQAGLDG